jgi:hypothetical protein
MFYNGLAQDLVFQAKKKIEEISNKEGLKPFPHLGSS